jgi:hypothetical protein
MSGIATKLFLFTILLTFGFQMVTTATKVGSVGAGSKTYNQTIGDINADLSDSIPNPKSFENEIISAIILNIPTVSITAIGLAFNNPLLAFAGIAITFLNAVAFPTAAINESFGGSLGDLLSNIISFLYLVSILSWWGSKSEP